MVATRFPIGGREVPSSVSSSRLPRGAWYVVAVALLAGCGESKDASRGVVAAAVPPAPAHWDAAAWSPPPASAIPNDSLGTAVRRGLALITHTTDSLPAFAPGKINCTNCHLDEGRNPDAAPLAGAHARFPKYMERTGAVIPLADRVNYCFTRSLGGYRIPVESREMQDILAYIAWLSSGVPVGEGKKLPGAEGLHEMAQKLEGDTARGAQVFLAKCTSCHGPDGQGLPGFPALWGPKSYSVGASMARVGKAASFIWHNMPRGMPKSLTPQEAFDVAAYIDARPRPDSPGKEQDWPTGGAPADVPYATKGHEAFRPPPVIARRDAAQTIVPKPAPIARRGTR